MSTLDSRTKDGRPAPLSVRSNFVWSLAGNVLYAFCQWGVLVLLVKLCSQETVGTYVLGLTVTSPIFMFAGMQLRRLQATDTQEDFQFGHYLGLQILACGLAMLACGATGWFSGHRDAVLSVVLLVGANKWIETLSNTFYGLFQQRERLDRISKSMVLQSGLSAAGLCGGIVLTGDLVWACAWSAIARLVAVILYDVPSLLWLAGESTRSDRSDLTRGISLEVAHSGSREATQADSLGRQPKETGIFITPSREAAADSNGRESAAASRLNAIKDDRNPWADAQGYLLTLLRSSKCATSENLSKGVVTERPRLRFGLLRGEWLTKKMSHETHRFGQRLSACRPLWDRGPLWRLALLGVPLGATGMLVSLNTNLPRYFVEQFGGKAALGIFGALCAPLYVMHTLTKSLESSASAQLARRHASGDLRGFRRLLGQLMVTHTAVALAGVVVAWLFGRPLLTLLFNADYAKHVDVFVAIMWATLVATSAGVMMTALIAARHIQIQLPLIATTSLTALVACWCLVPRFGMYGAAWSLAISKLPYLAVGLWLITKSSNRRAGDVSPPVDEDSARILPIGPTGELTLPARQDGELKGAA